MSWLGIFRNQRVNEPLAGLIMPAEDLAYIPVPGRTDQDNHEHALAAIQVQLTTRQPFQPVSTIILFGCKLCSYVRDETIMGAWSLEQVTTMHRQEGAADAG